MRFVIFLFFIAFMPIANVSFAQTKSIDNDIAFWNSLEKLCGKAYAGEIG